MAAIEAISNRIGSGLVASPLYQTPCFPPGSGPDYVNAAVRVSSDLSPAEILALCHEIEASHGRERLRRWGQRTLDIDLIACGSEVMPDIATFRRWHALPLAAQMEETPGALVLPHPRLQDRGFVLVPLAEIAPDWRHPVLGQTVVEMRDALAPEDRDSIRPL